MSRPKRDRQWWAGTVRSWVRSGKTAPEFAEAHDLSEHSLRWWKWKLGDEGALEETATSASREFVELDVAASVTAFTSFEIVTPDGWTIRVPRGFDAVELASVISAMEVES